MNFLLIICAINVYLGGALPINLNDKPKSVQTTAHRHDSILGEFRQNPKAFVAQMAKANPDTLREVLDLLRGLLSTSTNREEHLITTLDGKNEELNAANGAVADAQTVLSNANSDLGDAENAVVAAESDLAEKEGVAATKLTEKNDAQSNHDDEIDALNGEQEMIQQVIEILEDLLGSQSGGGSNGDVEAMFEYTGGVEYWTAEHGGSYEISAEGAGGGKSRNGHLGGHGAAIKTQVTLEKGEKLTISVGQRGGDFLSSSTGGGGGGGGSWVILSNGNLLVVAGGGGGASYAQSGASKDGEVQANGAAGGGGYAAAQLGHGGTADNGGGGGCGGGGGGWLSDGLGNSWVGRTSKGGRAGGAGKANYGGNGGWGGGGGSMHGGGGGGGYSGGGGGKYTIGGGGGGSWAANGYTALGYTVPGNGKVIIRGTD